MTIDSSFFFLDFVRNLENSIVNKHVKLGGMSRLPKKFLHNLINRQNSILFTLRVSVLSTEILLENNQYLLNRNS